MLLRLAHESIVSALEHREIPLDSPSPHFSEPRGAFTTLYFQGRLRGCVGYVLPVFSLYRAVAETARAAAFEDTRFSPVTLAEAPALDVSLSVLSPLKAIQPEQVEIASARIGGGPRRTPRPAIASSAGRTPLGPDDLHRADLPKGRAAPRCLAARHPGGVHCGSVRRPRNEVARPPRGHGSISKLPRTR